MGQTLSGKKTAFLLSSALPSIFLIILLLVPLVLGCAKKSVKPEEVRPEYADVLNRLTKGTKVYQGLETILYMTATYKTMDFRRAYVDRYVKSYQLEESYRSALLEREKEEDEKYNEVFFTAYTPESRWNDFDRTDSVWRLYLEDGSGARLIPVSVRRVDSSDPLIREFFPYFDLWSYGYAVKFPKYSETGTEPIPGEKTEYLKLVVTGILGHGEVEWRLKKK